MAQQIGLLEPELQLRRDIAGADIAGRQRAAQAGLLGDLYGLQTGAISALGGVGQQQRGLDQLQRDFAFQEFLREQGFPAQQIGLLSGVSQSRSGVDVAARTACAPPGPPRKAPPKARPPCAAAPNISPIPVV